VFHFVGWQFLTYLPSLGIMFALGGWFIAVSMNNKPAPIVIVQRLGRLLPTWWAFALLSLIGGYFYAAGTNVSLDPSLSWLFPYQRATWSLDNAYANDVTVVTWYIAAYLWLMMFSPLMMVVYKKLKWLAIYLPLFAMLIYSMYSTTQETVFGETMYDVLTFSACWMLGFAKADGSIEKLPKYIVWLMAIVCSSCAIFLTYDAGTLTGNPVALTLMSFGVAMLLLSFNPSLSFLPDGAKTVIRSVNTYAVTIYLFHNTLIDISYKLGDHLGAYRLGDYVGGHNGDIGNFSCFLILLGLMFVVMKTIGIVETHKWLPEQKPARQNKLATN